MPAELFELPAQTGSSETETPPPGGTGSPTDDRDAARSIRTPDQRLRVFISSTLAELAPERAAAREAVERLRLTPVLFEMGARPHPPRALCRAYLDQSDVFVGIYWQRYGWVAPDMDVSGLEDEYLLCGEKPRLVYLKRPAPEMEPRLSEFLNAVEREGSASYRFSGRRRSSRNSSRTTSRCSCPRTSAGLRAPRATAARGSSSCRCR